MKTPCTIRRASLLTLALASAQACAATPLAEQVRLSLAEAGTVERLAAVTLRSPSTDPQTLQAQAELAVESGDLDVALSFWRARCEQMPTADARARRTWASLAELAGREDEAAQAWRSVIALATPPEVADEGRVRLAMLLLDQGKPADARVLLDAVATKPTGLVAALFGDDTAALRALASAQDAPVSLQLVHAEVARRAGQSALAQRTFESVATLAFDPRDRRYASEQALAVGGQDLTRQWLADPNLSPERSAALAVALRESGRDAELLDWWRHQVRNPARVDALRSDRIVAEVISATKATGRAEDLAAVCHELLDGERRTPRTLIAAARLQLDAGNALAADALLDEETAQADATELLPIGKLARTLGRDAVARRVAARLAGLGGEDGVRGLLLRASIAQRAGKRDEAAVALLSAAAAARDIPDVALDVVAALDGAGRIDDAIALLSATAGADDERLLQLAGLLMQAHRPAEAMAVLDRLRQVTRSPGAAAQAGQRMLEIAGATNGLDALAANLKRAVTAGRGSPGDVLLLADTYQAAHRPELAVTLLRATPLLDEPTRLRRLATLFLRSKEYGRADEVLRRLLQVQPSDAVATLEQIAWVAIQRNNTADASQIIDEVTAHAGDGPTALELVGGLYDRLGFPAEAASHYRRAIALGGSAEDWLLWSTAMTKSGRPDVAGQRLQMLCVDGQLSDKGFVIAVDGVLGHDTPPAAVRAIRRAAVARWSSGGAGTALLHLVGDLSEELTDAPFGRRALAMVAAVSPDERSQALRTLCESAAASGDADGAVALGSSLLATGDTFPPQVFLDIGERLLVAGRGAAASRAFTRATGLSASDDTAELRVAAIYENYGRFADADRVLEPVVARHPRDRALVLKVARECEVLGRPHDAFTRYAQAANLDPLPGDAERLSRALVATARTDEDRVAAIDVLRRHLRDGGDPEWATAGRDALGRISLAQRIESTSPTTTAPSTEPIVAAPGPSDLPFLIASGDMERARAVLRSAPVSSPAEVCRTAPLCIAAAVALGDDAGVSLWSLRWLDAAGRDAGATAEVCRATWRVLQAPGRKAFVNALLSISHTAPTHENDPALLAVRLALRSQMPIDDWPSLANRLVDSPATAEPIAAELFADAPTSERLALLRLALGRVPVPRRLSLVAALIDRTVEPLDAATASALVDAMATVPTGQVIPTSDWFTRSAQRTVLPALAEAVLRIGGDDDANTARCAVAFSVAGDCDRADRTAMGAIDRVLGAARDDLSADVSVLELGGHALSTEARTALAGRLSTAVGPDQPARQLARIAAVLRACDRRAEALDIDRRNFAWHPSDDAAAAALATSLTTEGRPAELVDTLGPRSGHAWGAPVRRLVAAALLALGRDTEARQLDPTHVPALSGAAVGTPVQIRTELEAARNGAATFTAPATVDPVVVEDLLATLRAVPDVAGRSTGEIARAAARAAAHDSGAAARVLDDLTKRSVAGVFDENDVAITRELLAADSTRRLSPTLVGALWHQVRITGSDEAVAALDAALRASGSPEAVGAQAWTLARARMVGTAGTPRRHQP